MRLEQSEGVAWFPLGPLLHREHHSTTKRVAPPWSIPKALPLHNLTGVPRKRNRVQMKEQSKTSERELSDEEMANLPSGEFKALIIKMLTELIELGQK